MNRLPGWILLLALLVSANSGAGCLDKTRLTGINLAGAEFNSKKLPGVIFKDYTYPSTKELAFVAAQGANIIRLPFRWERLQPRLGMAFDAAELKRLQTTIHQAQLQDLCVLLDVHNYAKYYGDPITSRAHQDAFVHLWVELATQLGNPEYVALGLMNEPAYIPVADWAALAKRTLSALRAAELTHLVMVGGGGWNGLHSWFSEKDGNSNAKAFAGLKDPLKRTVVEVHQYADRYYSGTAQDCYPSVHFDLPFARIGQWAQDNNLQLFLGEFGMAATKPCLQTLEHFLLLMRGSEWKGWSYWAGGSWWGNYPFALNSDVLKPSPQWAPLKAAFFLGDDQSPPQPPVDATH
ncbi:MAG: glycoside hydrolase family 5 protein [Pseudomonadota bacterium]|nr:glycoside hydrolase family 5 protein [Pseudomonadota bacterium]